jgi:tryptophan synthase alpha chain
MESLFIGGRRLTEANACEKCELISPPRFPEGRQTAFFVTPMANRIDQTFERLRAKKQSAMIAYIAAGDPTLAATEALVPALEKAGVDLVELGLPFSDPLADGIVNQLAAARALEAGATTPKVLECVRAIRRVSQIPIVLYTYLNPIYQFGFNEFFTAAEAAGVDGLLILDLPPDEIASNPDFATHSTLKQIRLIAPTTPEARIATLTANASGFLYYVSREGVTGERAEVADSLAERVAAIRATTPLPIAVGFGISTPEHVRQVATVADAVVVGSAIVKKIAEWGKDPTFIEKMVEFVTPLASASKQP